MFENREKAGQLLAEKLTIYRDKNVIILGIPRGGVVVAKVAADMLQLPLDIIVVKKIGAPNNPELAIGAIAGAKIVYWDSKLCQQLGVNENQKSNIKNQKEEERAEREKLLRGKRKMITIKNKIVLLVDDGVATGATVIAAAKFVKKTGAKEIILAIPVIAKDTLLYIKRYFDDVVFLESPQEFYAVGQFYQEFNQITDDEVIKILEGSL